MRVWRCRSTRASLRSCSRKICSSRSRCATDSSVQACERAAGDRRRLPGWLELSMLSVGDWDRAGAEERQCRRPAVGAAAGGLGDRGPGSVPASLAAAGWLG